MRRKDTVMKNTKSIIAFTLVMVIIVSVFAACSTRADETAAENTSSESASVLTTAENTTAQSTKDISSDESVNGSAETNGSNPSGNSNSGSGRSNTTTKKTNTTTTKKSVTTTEKQTTTKKTTTTTKKTTTTTTKHVSAKDVQNQVNNYIKSKGWSIATDFTPSNSSWTGRISGSQENLDNGYTLKRCKEEVDFVISDGANKQWGMYCYYNNDNQKFYILYSY